MTKSLITEMTPTIEPVEAVQEQRTFEAPIVNTPSEQRPRKGKRTGDYVFDEALRKLQLSMHSQLRSNR